MIYQRCHPWWGNRQRDTKLFPGRLMIYAKEWYYCFYTFLCKIYQFVWAWYERMRILMSRLSISSPASMGSISPWNSFVSYSKQAIHASPPWAQSSELKDKQSFCWRHFDSSSGHQKPVKSSWHYKQRRGRVAWEEEEERSWAWAQSGHWTPSETTWKKSRETWRYGWRESSEIWKAFWPEMAPHV